MEPIRIGILGLGNVGTALVNLLQQNGEEITRRAGREIKVTACAVRDVEKPRDCDLAGVALSKDPAEIVERDDVDVVIELMGGTHPAKQILLESIAKGKPVVTANKALIAHYGNEIFAAAQEQGVSVAFEAAVAGGIPIIKAIREGLAGNRIEDLAGIINGTCNYILTEMFEEAADFPHMLAQAQKLGYAEADPSFDVDGIDVAHKITILASIAFGIPLQYDDVYKEGISKITPLDLNYASELGFKVKHFGIAKRTAKGVEVRVHPVLIKEKRLLANVNGVMNAVLVNGDAVGRTVYYGAGAGGMATASAVVADLVDVVRALTTDPENRVPHLAFQADAIHDTPILPINEVECANYLRLSVIDEAGVLAEIAQILADFNISIEALLQKEPVEGSEYVPIVITTKQVLENNMRQAIEKIESLPSVEADIMQIRLYE